MAEAQRRVGKQLTNSNRYKSHIRALSAALVGPAAPRDDDGLSPPHPAKLVERRASLDALRGEGRARRVVIAA
jgi:hypothetical protein